MSCIRQNADGLTLDLANVTGDFKVRWYDPARGGDLQTGSVLTVTGGRQVGSRIFACGER